MSRFFAARILHPRLVAVLALAIAVGHVPSAWAIEMFTFFGDGSRVGLPSLEVPIEAYPGIPLRSDRIRARNRALALRRGAAMPARQPGAMQPSRGITVRAMPVGERAPEAIPIAPEPE
ncbi:MAG: hypothetical protein EBR28_12860 [Planctomycetia bacterium]|nr:hypothetical protein [Planctomycetia bacterium]